jgi:hypothetical protein
MLIVIKLVFVQLQLKVLNPAVSVQTGVDTRIEAFPISLTQLEGKSTYIELLVEGIEFVGIIETIIIDVEFIKDELKLIEPVNVPGSRVKYGLGEEAVVVVSYPKEIKKGPT